MQETSLALPGRSYAPALVGEELDWGEEVTFHEYENARTIRTSKWKFTKRFPDGPDDLYDLEDDPGERENVIVDPQHEAVAEQLSRKLKAFFERYSSPQHDLWRGGTTKAGKVIPELHQSGAD